MNSKQEVLENIIFADQYISVQFPDLKRLELVITGGASLLLKGFRNKFTLDIDTITELEKSVIDYLEAFSINNAASEVTVLSKSYTDRLIRYSGKFQVLDIYLLSNEDLIISKIGRLSDSDLHDLEKTGILDAVNMQLLEKLAEEIASENDYFKRNWVYFQQSVLVGR